MINWHFQFANYLLQFTGFLCCFTVFNVLLLIDLNVPQWKGTFALSALTRRKAG